MALRTVRFKTFSATDPAELEDKINQFIDQREKRDIISAPSLRFFVAETTSSPLRFYAGFFYETDAPEDELEDANAR